MWRHLIRLGWMTMWIAWAAAVAVWWRGLFRADLIGVVLPGHVYIEVERDANEAHAQAVIHWPAPLTLHHSSGPSVRDGMEWAYSDPLTGPSSTFGELFTKNNTVSWDGFDVSRSRLCFTTAIDGRPLMNVSRRGWDVSSDRGPALTGPLPAMSVGFPTWAIPGGCSTPRAIGLAVIYSLQRRRGIRRRRGLCVRCGYDRRQSPDRCPECGATAAT